MLSDQSQLKKSAHLLKTLGNPHRLHIIQQLMGGEKNVTAINAVVDVSQPALSQHLSRLRSAGILGARRDQRQIYYFITNEYMARLIALLGEMVHSADSRKQSIRA